MSQARDLADLGGSASAGGITGRNLIINGAMQVAQRGTSDTSAGYLIDRFKAAHNQVAVTQSQQTLTSGSPYDSGFRHFYRLANTSVSSATNAYAEVNQIFEAKNISQSGWNYKSTNSFITISFWARSSLAGTYYVMLRTFDGTEYRRNLSFTLVADTWTKVEVTTAGNSNLQIDNDVASGLTVFVVPHYGTDFTGGGEVSTTDWYDRNGQSDAYLPNYAQNWSNTASATFDITGVQLELGETATPFEHEDIATTLAKCQRYYFRWNATLNKDPFCMAFNNGSAVADGIFSFPVRMRAKPSALEQSGTAGNYRIGGAAGAKNCTAVPIFQKATLDTITVRFDVGSGLTSGQCGRLQSASSTGANAFLGWSAEL